MSRDSSDAGHSSFKIGLLKDQIGGSAPDFFEPMSEDEIAGWEGSH